MNDILRCSWSKQVQHLNGGRLQKWEVISTSDVLLKGVIEDFEEPFIE